jgi:D-aminopeptidase
MEDAISYHSIMSNAVESLSSATLKSLAITRLIITGSEIDDGGIASLVLGLRGMPSLKASPTPLFPDVL